LRTEVPCVGGCEAGRIGDTQLPGGASIAIAGGGASKYRIRDVETTGHAGRSAALVTQCGSIHDAGFHNAAAARYGLAMHARRSGRGARLRKTMFVILWAACALLAVGVSGADDAAVRAFDAAASSWQTDPDFRRV